MQDDSSNLFLQVMICIAVFLFGVTLAGVLSINSMLATWNESILGSLTVQVMPINDINAEQAKAQTLAQQEKAVELLQSKPEVDKVTPLNNEQLQKLIQPWLGDGVEINELPIPRLIDVRLKPGAEVDFIRWAEELAEAAPQASLDNHKLWLNKLIKFCRRAESLSFGCFGIGYCYYLRGYFLLHADQSWFAQAYHRNFALDGRERYLCGAAIYAKRTAWLGFLGGIYGLFLAIPTIFVIANLARQIEGGIISEARLTLSDWSAILSLPPVFNADCHDDGILYG